MITSPRLVLSCFSAVFVGTALSFAPSSQLLHSRLHASRPTVVFSTAVENPFKNPDLLQPDGDSEDALKLDPASLLAPRLCGYNIYLIGMMGSGKSAVGKALSKRTGYTFLDTDEIIEKAAEKSIPAIFEEDGEPAFRETESDVLDGVLSCMNCVMSTGGGLVMQDKNWDKLQDELVLFLNVDPEVIIKRIEGTDRPLLQTENPLETLKELMKDRQPRYEEATVTVDVSADMDVQMTVDACVEAIHNYVDEHPPQGKKEKIRNVIMSMIGSGMSP
mmetsp:Transcript_15424/g.19884  ORF Transcript_15424/g.19884 Transcript_15424/m.19884 type:complete len:275 (-) Transcript_15424:186-1010(-)|eukprot:CAMPEP_0183721880 /NCGR_PEP_ID=MMETSP0737-20130205/14002_1 /TAXON_ID=385413 /ORGANISM="Thalassiosira miniscula, Strain CCMP1093" /LENGTH=274 /DNA_ID=CAMNT_0025951943 /DNA_START=83 /DNA_END=907 /DNA_ORIENTATION=-